MTSTYPAFHPPEIGEFVTFPPHYALGWVISAIVILVPLALAVVSMVRNRTRITFTGTAVWVAVVLFLPVIGPVLWFVVGRPREQVLTG